MATQRQEVDLIVRAIAEGFDRVAEDIRASGKAVEDASDDAKHGSTRWTELSSQINIAKQAFGQVSQAIGVAVDALKRGAEVEATAATFDQLSASIGTTSRVLMQEMRAATSNTVSDFDLMQSANRLMAMGLATSAEEAGKLSKVAVQLGAAMGKGPTEAMEEFALLMANQSIPRLDTFGISAGKVRTRIKELQEQTPGLTREMAFMQATMEEAEISMGKLGDSTDNVAGDLARVETAWTNLNDAFKRQLATEVAEQLDLLGDAAGGSADQMDMVGKGLAISMGDAFHRAMNTTFPGMSLALRDFQAMLIKVAEQQERQARITQDDRPRFEHWTRATDDRTAAARRLAGAMHEVNDPYFAEQTEAQRRTAERLAEKKRELAAATQQVRDRLMEEAKAWFEAVKAQREERYDEIRRKQELAAEAAAEYRAALDDQNASLADAFGRALEAEGPMQNLNDLFWEQVQATDADARTLALAGVATGQFTKAQAEAALKAAIFEESVRKIAEAVADGDMTMGEAMDQLGRLQDKLNEDYTFDLAGTEDAINKLADIKSRLDGMAGRETRHRVVIEEVTERSVVDGGNKGGGNKGGNKDGNTTVENMVINVPASPNPQVQGRRIASSVVQELAR